MTLPRILSLGVRYWLHRYWTAAALLLLLATGAASAVVAMVVVWTVWGRPLPFRAPAELLAIADSRTVGISEAEFADWADRQRTLEEIASYDVTSATMVELALMKYPARVATVTPNLFRLLGVSPAVGRVFHGGDRGAPIQIGVVSDAFFRRVMGGDPSIIATTITLIRPLERSSLRVVGFCPRVSTWITGPRSTCMSSRHPNQLTVLAHNEGRCHEGSSGASRRQSTPPRCRTTSHGSSGTWSASTRTSRRVRSSCSLCIRRWWGAALP